MLRFWFTSHISMPTSFRHVTGPQVLGVKGQFYRSFKDEDVARDYYAKRCADGIVTAVSDDE
jgi:hypothetical protein